MVSSLDYNVHVRRRTTVARPAVELYHQWRTPQRLADFVYGAEPITVMDERRTRWAVRIPGLGWRTWASELTEDEPGVAIVWRTIGETDLPHEWTVRFAPTQDGRSTDVTLEIRSQVTGGHVTDALARLTGRSLEDHAAVTLRNFKELMETGRVPRTRKATSVRHLTRARRRAIVAAVLAAIAAFALVRQQQSRRTRPVLALIRGG